MFWNDFRKRSYAEDEREAASRDLIDKCGYAAAALTLLPLPGSEIVAVMPVHVGMVVAVGHIYGHTLTKQSATDMVLRIGATVGLSLLGSRIATTAAKIILPGLGGLLAAPFMYASTYAIGAVARAYFVAGGSLSEAEIKDVYERAAQEAKSTFDPKRAQSEDARRAASEAAQEAKARSPRERLEELKKLRDEGLIEADEYERTKAKVLEDL